MSVISNNQLAGASGQGGTGQSGAYQIERSLRFNSSDSAYLSRTPASAGNRKTWTWSGWVKRVKLGDGTYTSDEWLLRADSGGSDFFLLGFSANDAFYSTYTAGVSAGGENYTTAIFRDISAWYHIVFAFDTTQTTATDRVKMYVNGVQQTLAVSNPPAQNSDYQVNSTNLHRIGGMSGSYADFYLADVHFIDGQALDPTSFTETDANGVLQPKAYSGGSYGTNGFHLDFSDNSTAAALGTDNSSNSNTWTVNNITATEINGRLYSQATGTSTSAFSNANLVGDFPASASNNYIYDAELNTSVTSVTFGYSYTFNGVEILVSNDGTNWTSKGTQTNAYTTVTNGTAFKYVRWFIAQNWQHGITNNPANIDSLVDSPTNYGTDTGAGGEVRGNYCTFNSLAVPLSGTHVLSNGNLDVSTNSGNIIGTYFLTSGKWYWEVNAGGYVGICGKNGVGYTGSISASGSDAYGYWNNGRIYSGVGSYVTGGSTFTSSDIIGVALDMDGGTVKWYKNNVLQYNLALNYSNWEDLRGGVFPCINGGGGSSLTFAANFGARPFAYTAPSGYKALCTQNLPTPTIEDGSTAMDVLTWTGNGASSRDITNLAFNPDLVWVKNRSGGQWHNLIDSVRGASRDLYSNAANAEALNDTSGTVSAFNSNGFTLAAGSVDASDVNASGSSYVGWTWDAGSSTVSNTDGSITSSVRANASAGFSIVTWTGTANATVGHGLNAAPQLVITKSRNNNVPWRIWSAEFSNAAADYMGFDTSGAATFPGTYWGSMTSTTIGMSSTYHNNMGDMVAYCFAPVDGYSSFGSYTGNGSTDGTFVHTGFRPRWVMIKRSSTSGSNDHWNIVDTVRGTYNVIGPYLNANTSGGENTYSGWDLLSNGFKLRNIGSSLNSSGSTYIYAAFAENPFAYTRAR